MFGVKSHADVEEIPTDPSSVLLAPMNPKALASAEPVVRLPGSGELDGNVLAPGAFSPSRTVLAAA